MSKMIFIDGKEFAIDGTKTVLQIARENGIYIPSLCYHPKLGSASMCRVCVVEVDGTRNLQTACSMVPAEGMKISTKSPRVIEARKMVVNLLLSNGNHNCLICERNGDCELQDAAYHLGIDIPAFQVKEYEPKDDSSPMIIRDGNKCIQCGRCVEACNRLVVNEVLDFGYRGGHTAVICDDDKLMGESSCVQCGECVQVCPVGALYEKKRVGKGRAFDNLKKVRTTCPYCGVGCQQELHLNGDQIVRIKGVESGKPNDGHLCVKGRFGYDFIYSKERLTTPLIRQANGEFKEAGWDEAFDLIKSKFTQIIKESGPDAVAGVSCARSINEDSYNMQKLFRAVFKTNNIDHCARVCHAPTVAGLAASFGSGASSNSIGEFKNAKQLFVIGSNMTEAHPVASYFVKQAHLKGAPLIVVDPRKNELAKRSDIFAQIKVGTDVAFLNGIMNVLIAENLYDKKFVDANCKGFDELKAMVAKYPPEKAAEISKVSAEMIIRIARQMSSIKPTMLIYTLGITEHTCGTDNVMSCANLQMLLGNMGLEFGGVNPLRGQNNVQGACDMGALPNVFPGYQKVTDAEAKAKFEKAWSVSDLPTGPGLMIPDMLAALPSKKIRALWIFGENLANAEPNITHTEHCLESAEFLVVQDIFPNETTKFAHVILPAASWCEDEGTFTSAERRVSMVRKIKEAPGISKPNWMIFKDFAAKMGHTWDSSSGRDICDNELAVLCPMFAGITFNRIANDGIQWPCPNIEHPGSAVLHRDGKFTHGKGILKAIEWAAPGEVEDRDYPFILSTGRRLSQYHTRTQTGRSGMDLIFKRETADISIEDAARLGVKDGEIVRVKSRRGEVKVPARVTDEIPAGMVWMTFHYREGNCNWLTSNFSDKVTKTPEFKACAVKVERI
ncbi:MAG TPA: formate dehydrogenase subunit alpha [Spirochaetota bacterium]|nr:formate dehydrogenase subunit alpha [Spirochaetota bacterium]